MPSLLYVRLPAIPADIEPAWNTWYDAVHMRYRFDKPGFRAARRYRVTAGGSRYLALYEIDGPEALVSPPYLAHRDWETAQPEGTFEYLGPRLPGFARGVYEQRAPMRPYAVPTAAGLRVTGFDFPDDDTANAFAAWCAGDAVAALAAQPGVAAARSLTLTAAPLGPRTGVASGTPRVLVACDLVDAAPDARAAAAFAAFDRDVAARWSAHGMQAKTMVAALLFAHVVAPRA